MTIRELIRRLRSYPLSAEVVVATDPTGDWCQDVILEGPRIRYGQDKNHFYDDEETLTSRGIPLEAQEDVVVLRLEAPQASR